MVSGAVRKTAKCGARAAKKRAAEEIGGF